MKKLALLAILAGIFLVSCGTVPVETQVSEPEKVVTVVVTATSAPTSVEIVEDPTEEAVPTEISTPTEEVCLQDNPYSQLNVGYIEGYVGIKKSPVVVETFCNGVWITFEDGSLLTGTVAEDGLSLNYCSITMALDGKTWTCEVKIHQDAALNDNFRATGKFFKKTSNGLICLAESNKNYSDACDF